MILIQCWYCVTAQLVPVRLLTSLNPGETLLNLCGRCSQGGQQTFITNNVCYLLTLDEENKSLQRRLHSVSTWCGVCSALRTNTGGLDWHRTKSPGPLRYALNQSMWTPAVAAAQTGPVSGSDGLTHRGHSHWDTIRCSASSLRVSVFHPRGIINSC